MSDHFGSAGSEDTEFRLSHELLFTITWAAVVLFRCVFVLAGGVAVALGGRRLLLAGWRWWLIVLCIAHALAYMRLCFCVVCGFWLVLVARCAKCYETFDCRPGPPFSGTDCTPCTDSPCDSSFLLTARAAA